ncbi:MAG: alpha/beta hydrolase [Bacteroidetes bacterium]|nr:MAG: alpha/beta hydrolase [Bacteroidota bacterium]
MPDAAAGKPVFTQRKPPAMKKIVRLSAALLGVILLLIAFWAIKNYHKDIPVEVLKEKYAYPDSRFTEVMGMNVHYRVTGTGFPLVLIHGTAASLHTWEAWTDILSPHFQVISFDLPAYGLTGPHPERRYTVPDYVEFVDAFLNKIGVDSCHMAGNSLGGDITWQYAAEHPEKVGKIILLDPSGYPVNRPPSLAFRLVKKPLLKNILLKITPKSLVEKSLKEVLYNDELATDERITRYFEMAIREGNRQAFADRVLQVLPPDTLKVRTVQRPALILWGANDEWIPLEHAYKFKRDLPDAKLIVYEQCGHIPMEEIPEKSAADALQFLQ